MLIGLAGKNIRRAMEIFLDFCKSGHIGAKEYLKIRMLGGNYAFPQSLVVRVLLRSNRRYYEGDRSHVKNLFQCNPTDTSPNHFIRFSILQWLRDHLHEVGPIGVQGFHRVDRLISELLPFGYNADRIRDEINYLVQAMCIVAEHQRVEFVSDNDLVTISPAGYAHLGLVADLNYLAAVAEDTWVEDEELAKQVAGRIGGHGRKGHYRRDSVRSNALEFVINKKRI